LIKKIKKKGTDKNTPDLPVPEATCPMPNIFKTDSSSEEDFCIQSSP